MTSIAPINAMSGVLLAVFGRCRAAPAPADPAGPAPDIEESGDELAAPDAPAAAPALAAIVAVGARPDAIDA